MRLQPTSRRARNKFSCFRQATRPRPSLAAEPQREHHKLKGDWGVFCREVVTQVNRPDLLPRLQILTLEGFYEPQIEGNV